MKSKKNLFNILICLVGGVIITAFVFFSTGVETLASHFRSLNLFWVGAAVGCMLLYWLLETAILHVMTKPAFPEQSFRGSLCVSMGGQYFNSITPFASGGQPFQAYCLKKQGMELGSAINTLLSKFLVTQTCLTVVTTVLLMVRLPYFREILPNFTVVIWIGYLITLLVLLAVLSFAVFPQAARRFCLAVILLLTKLRFLKNPEAKIRYMDEELEKCRKGFRSLIRNPSALFRASGCSILQLIAYMAVPYMIYRAFGLSEIDFLTILAAQAFVMMTSSFVPLPGASAGAEGFFYFFFRRFFIQDGQVGLAVILWRVITFYFTIVVGAAFAVRANRIPNK